jgi:hypothetical protein
MNTALVTLLFAHRFFIGLCSPDGCKKKLEIIVASCHAVGILHIFCTAGCHRQRTENIENAVPVVAHY